MDANLPLAAASQVEIPWLSLIVLLPAAGALVMQLLPLENNLPTNLPRNLAIGFLLVDFIIIIAVFSNLFNNNLPDIAVTDSYS